MPGRNRIGPYLTRRADAARDAGQFREAAFWYEEALRLRPEAVGLIVQAGHMRKEAGDFAEADDHYRAALLSLPEDADLALQLGHFHKLQGHVGRAAAEYRRALALQPGWAEPERELRQLRGTDREEADDLPAPNPAGATSLSPEMLGRLVPALAPAGVGRHDLRYEEGVTLRRLGRPEQGRWGLRRTLRGIEAIRGFVISSTPVLGVTVLLDGETIHRGEVRGGYPLARAAVAVRLRKYVFNLWLDFSHVPQGLHVIELQFDGLTADVRPAREQVAVDAPVPEADQPWSDAVVQVLDADPRPLERQIGERPSMIRPAKRGLFPEGVRNVLVMRTDQLGDMVASIPAVQRLRTLVPEARLVGLLTAANADLAHTLELFDEIIVIEFPDDPIERRRLMPLDRQEELRRRLEPYRFDIALDLAQSTVSRELLRLAGARFTYGVEGQHWPWLTAEFMFNSHDRWSGMDIVPHSAKVLAMVEALGAVLRNNAQVIRRSDLTRERLEAYGLRRDARYIVLHMGARIAFSRWPHFAELARLLLDRTDLDLVMMTEDASQRASMPPELLASPRLIYLDQRLPFDDFDALLSFATVLVGNDSGPKHLAALRGTSVVTLFTARINSAEWGQEEVGSIISRRVPCQGCAIFHDAEECGRDFTCITEIKPSEVLETVLRYV